MVSTQSGVSSQPQKRLVKVDILSYKTISANSATVDKQWIIIDAKDQTLGRLASEVAFRIRGKHKTNFTPHVDCGDNVIVINADAVTMHGDKMNTKTYLRYTGYPGGQRSRTAAQESVKRPTRIVEHAVKGMLPKTKLGAALFRNLHVYVGAEHNHEAQKPPLVTI